MHTWFYARNSKNDMPFKEFKRIRRYLKTGIIDSLRLYTKGGTGGCGLPKYGGVGGQGGSVIAEASEDVKDLMVLLSQNPTKRLIANNGSDSTVNALLGTPGGNVVVKVPVGISLYRDDGKYLGELNKNGSKALLARGGVGGSKATGYLGLKGQAHSVNFDYKLVADISFVGFPNAGKSTLLKALCKSKPKIASYPFTTIQPNVGKIQYKDLRQITAADLPGLVEGAHANIGMGHKFLKHVERTKFILMIVDVMGFQLSYKYRHRSCLETILLLNKELELYKEEVLHKPSILVINKMDLKGSQKIYDEVVDNLNNLPEIIQNYPEELQPERLIRFDHIQPLIANDANHDSVKLLKNKIRDLLDLYLNLEEKTYHNEDEIVRNLKDSITEKSPILC